MRLRSGFTLVELLVVIAIVAILAVVVVTVLNPVQLLKQSRDSNRIAELASLNKALAVYTTDVGTTGLGSASTTYISIPDTSAICANLGLPALPSGWNYHCVTADTLRDTDGTGWIPVNFSSISFKSPLGSLPIDPTNTTSTRSYYSYTTSGGKYELTAQLESDKYEAKAGTDGGPDPASYEAGTNKDIAPFMGGLVGWWKFDEGSGGNTLDSSGFGNTGTWYGTSSIRYSTGKVGSYSGAFNGINDYAGRAGYSLSTNNGTFSIILWLKPDTLISVWRRGIVMHENYLVSGYRIGFANGGAPMFWTNQSGGTLQVSSSVNLNVNNWNQLAVVYDNQQGYIYLNGIQTGASNGTYLAASNTLNLGSAVNETFSGLIDDVRIYNRALSAAEIQALYNATR